MAERTETIEERVARLEKWAHPPVDIRDVVNELLVPLKKRLSELDGKYSE